MPKNKAGRPRIVTSDVVKKLEDGFLLGLNVVECCLYANITKATFYNYANENEGFLDRMKQLQENIKMRAKLNLANDIKQGDVDTSKWYLEKKKKKEFSVRSEHEVTGEVTQNINYNTLTDDELEKEIKGLMQDECK